MNITVTRFLNASICQNCGGTSITINSRYSCSLIVTRKGALRFTEGGNTVISTLESPIFIPSGASYINYCIEDADSLMVNFHADTDVAHITALSPTSLSRLEPHYVSLTALSDKSLASPLSFSEECRAVSDIYSLLALLTDTPKHRTDTERLFDKATEFIISQIRNPDLSCSLVASHLCISEVYLRRLFAKYSGIPTWQYIRKIRLEKARQMLADNATVTNTAYSVGYHDVYSFSRAYSAYFGHPPSKEVY